MTLIDIGGNRDDGVKGVVHSVSLSQPVLDKYRQVLLVSDQLVIVAEPGPVCVLFEQHHVVLDHFGPLPQLFECCECVAGLVDCFKLCVEGGDKSRVVSEWWCQSLHLLDDAHRPISGVLLQK